MKIPTGKIFAITSPMKELHLVYKIFSVFMNKSAQNISCQDFFLNGHKFNFSNVNAPE